MWARCTAKPSRYLVDGHAVCAGCLVEAQAAGLDWMPLADRLSPAARGFQAREVGIRIRLNGAELEEIQRAACDRELTVAAFVRAVVLDAAGDGE